MMEFPEDKFEEQIEKLAVVLEVMSDEIDRLKKQRSAYERAVNELDDFFEYSNESDKDRARVYLVLDNLRITLSTMK